MNLLLINYEYPPVGGGAATATFHLARELRRLSHDVTVLTSRYSDAPGYELDGDGIHLHRVAALRQHRDRGGMLQMSAFTLAAAMRLPAVLRQHQVEGLIVYFSIPCGPLGLLARWWAGTPYVISLRGGDVPGLVPGGVEVLHRLLAPLRRLVLRGSVSNVANSPGLRTLSGRTDAAPVIVIPNGVDTEYFCPADHPPAGRRELFRVLFVGRLQEQKNLVYLLREFAAARKHGGAASSLRLEIAGDGPQRAMLQAQAEELGVANAVGWHGWLGRASLRELLQGCDGFVNPSRFEGMPNAVLEAMACGLPVVASRVVGNDAVVRDGETGFLFELDEAGALSRLLRRIALDPTLARRLGAEGRAWTKRDFSWSQVASAYADLLRIPASAPAHLPGTLPATARDQSRGG